MYRSFYYFSWCGWDEVEGEVDNVREENKNLLEKLSQQGWVIYIHG